MLRISRGGMGGAALGGAASVERRESCGAAAGYFVRGRRFYERDAYSQEVGCV